MAAAKWEKWPTWSVLVEKDGSLVYPITTDGSWSHLEPNVVAHEGDDGGWELYIRERSAERR